MSEERFQEGSHPYKSDWKEHLAEGVWIDGVCLPDAFYDFYAFEEPGWKLGVRIEVVRNPNHPEVRLLNQRLLRERNTRPEHP